MASRFVLHWQNWFLSPLFSPSFNSVLLLKLCYSCKVGRPTLQRLNPLYNDIMTKKKQSSGDSPSYFELHITFSERSLQKVTQYSRNTTPVDIDLVTATGTAAISILRLGRLYTIRHDTGKRAVFPLTLERPMYHFWYILVLRSLPFHFAIG